MYNTNNYWILFFFFFSLINAGRPVEVRCFGNSILINSSICPNNTQFKKETSISDAW